MSTYLMYEKDISSDGEIIVRFSEEPSMHWCKRDLRYNTETWRLPNRFWWDQIYYQAGYRFVYHRKILLFFTDREPYDDFDDLKITLSSNRPVTVTIDNYEFANIKEFILTSTGKLQLYSDSEEFR